MESPPNSRGFKSNPFSTKIKHVPMVSVVVRAGSMVLFQGVRGSTVAVKIPLSGCLASPPTLL